MVRKAIVLIPIGNFKLIPGMFQDLENAGNKGIRCQNLITTSLDGKTIVFTFRTPQEKLLEHHSPKKISSELF